MKFDGMHGDRTLRAADCAQVMDADDDFEPLKAKLILFERQNIKCIFRASLSARNCRIRSQQSAQVAEKIQVADKAHDLPVL